MMKITKAVFLLFLLNITSLNMVRPNENSDLIEIVEKLVNNNSTRNIQYVTILTTDKFLNDQKTKDFVLELIKELSKSKAIMKMNEKAINKLSKKRILMTLMLLNSMEDFENIVKMFTNRRFNYSGYYVILFQNADDANVKKIFHILWNFYIYNVNLIRCKNESVIVETYVPFRPMNCNNSDLLQIAKYENGKFIFKPDNFFPKKFNNFHKCSLGLATFASLAPSVLKRDFKNGSYELYGRDIETMKMLAHELNFYPNITYLPAYGSWGVLYPNGTTTGAMGRAVSRTSDIAWGNLNLKIDRTLIMDYSFGYYLETLIFVIPKGEPYSAFSKLLRPFDNFVWTALLLVILICIVIIALLTLLPRKIQNFVYGEKVSNPLLNVLIAMFGGAQTKLPTYNFARSLLIMFLLFCLILRSLYQGALFQFLQANDNKPEVGSIAEMAEHNFKFYLIPSYDDMTKNNTLMKGKRVIIQPSELKTIMDNTIDVQFKGSLLVAISEIIYKNKLRSHSQEALFTVCKVSRIC